MPRFRWLRTTDGQDLLEYAIVGAFVAIVVLAGATGLGSSLNHWFDAVAGLTEESAESTAENAKKSNCSARAWPRHMASVTAAKRTADVLKTTCR